MMYAVGMTKRTTRRIQYGERAALAQCARAMRTCGVGAQRVRACNQLAGRVAVVASESVLVADAPRLQRRLDVANTKSVWDANATQNRPTSYARVDVDSRPSLSSEAPAAVGGSAPAAAGGGRGLAVC